MTAKVWGAGRRRRAQNITAADALRGRAQRLPQIKPAHIAGLVTCSYCERGFRRISGVHIASQRLGMIPDTPCELVFAADGGSPAKPWMAYVDGQPLRTVRRYARRFATAVGAYSAACRAAPRAWHD